MLSPSPASNTPPRQGWLFALPIAVALAYGLGHLGWYFDTPLGRVPVLDERENLLFANAIASHTLPAEPFYRAPGYALLLAGFRIFGVPFTALFSIALFTGVLLHALNAFLVARIAGAWFDRRAGLVAGLVFALHPVFIHYSTQALDAVPALTFFLAGLSALNHTDALSRGSRREEARAHAILPWALASLCWAAATLTRPNYLLLWLLLPILALVLQRAGDAAPSPRRLCDDRQELAASTTPSHRTPGLTSLAACTGALLFLFVALWQQRISGTTAMLPTQGPYNLWAANQPGAHGRYYVQHISLPASLALQNPARSESLVLFQQETGAIPDPHNLTAANRHWRVRFFDYVAHHPLAWLGQLARKTYTLLNDWEQYNNKTFAFHRARSPWLRWNPISWGILFVLAIAGAARLVQENHSSPAPTPSSAGLRPASRQSKTGATILDSASTRNNRTLLLSLAAITLTCALSIVLFFVSARFRLPLAALEVIFAAGALAAPGFWRAWPAPRQAGLACGLLAAAGLTFSNFDRVRDRSTFVQDHALLARAAASIGDDATSWTEARAALELQPQHPDALRLGVASYFNLLLANTAATADESAWLSLCRTFLAAPSQQGYADLRAVAGVALWRHGEKNEALALWRQPDAGASARGARTLAGDLSAAELKAFPKDAWSAPLVRLAAAHAGIPAPPGVPSDSPLDRHTAARLFHLPASR